MFNPFDGAVFASCWAGSFALGVLTGNSPVVAAVASAFVMGIFALIAKAGQIIFEYYRDKERQRLRARAERAEADVVRLLQHNQNLIAGR
jgi:hypothetical protein